MGGDRLTVLHVLPEDSWRGAQVYAGRLRDAFMGDPDQRHIVAALFDAPPAGLRPDLVLTGHGQWLRRAGLDPLALRALRRTIRRERVDVLVAHGGEPLKYVVAVNGSIPVVYYKIGLSSAELTRRSRLGLYRFLAARVALGVAVSSAVNEQLRHQLRVPPSQVRIIPNARDPEVYRPGDRPHQGRGRVLFIGQLESGKRPELFLEVVAHLRDMGLDFSAAVVGHGSLRAGLETRAEAVGVTFLGVRDDVPELLRDAAVVVMTSARETEGMPGVLIEAGMSGVPVVSSPAAGVTDVVIDGVTGVVVHTDDVRELADRTAELLRDPDNRRTMGARARAHCIENFSLAVGASQWRSAIEDVVRATRRVSEE